MEPPAGSHARRVGAVRRLPVDLSQFTPVREHLLVEGQPLPLVLEPTTEQVDLIEWIGTHLDDLRQKLAEHGGLLFRNFGLREPAEFERAAGSICRTLYSAYGDLPRAGVAGKIYEATPYPEDQAILFHNEGSHMGRWPRTISFFCATPAQEGGATPVVDCRKVYRDLEPEVRQAFETKGLLYVRNFCGVDVSWQQFFGTDDRSVVEQACRQTGAMCEWRRDDALRVSQRCEAVRRHPVTGEKTFFTQVQLHHVHCLDAVTSASMRAMFSPDDFPRQVLFGDGTPIETSVTDHVGAIYERHAVRFPWQRGGMISLDNLVTAHARDPYVGPRKILVAMGDMNA